MRRAFHAGTQLHGLTHCHQVVPMDAGPAVHEVAHLAHFHRDEGMACLLYTSSTTSGNPVQNKVVKAALDAMDTTAIPTSAIDALFV